MKNIQTANFINIFEEKMGILSEIMNECHRSILVPHYSNEDQIVVFKQRE